LTDVAGEIAWSVQYKAWGAAQEVITDAARKAGIHNPLRFQGQYYDHETGLYYNRHRYYDPVSGRFVSKDPIGLAGGINVYAYAFNPTGWIDPLGLQSTKCPCACPEGTLEASKIHFMQNNAKNTTGEYTVLGNAEGLASGTLDPNILRVRVWEDTSGKTWTLDHRRLAAFKLAKVKCVPVKKVTREDLNPSEVRRKMSTKNGGTSMEVKLENGKRVKVE
jgi:RHS repeat-associated protein